MQKKRQDYFNSYDHVSPARLVFLGCGGNPDFDLASSPHFKGLEKVTAQNYPKLFRAVKDEAAFRGIKPPLCYIDHKADYVAAAAMPRYYALFFAPDAYEALTPKELRLVVAHEIKHLFEGRAETPQETREEELDCDRNSIDSADYKTAVSVAGKYITLALAKGKVTDAFRQVCAEETAGKPDVPLGHILETLDIPNDNVHPSWAQRLATMKEREQQRIAQNLPVARATRPSP